MKQWYGVVLFLSAALSINFGNADEKTPTKIVRIPLITAQLANEKLVDRVEVKKIVFVPLQKTGLHLHPIPVIGFIVKGTVNFQIDGEKPQTLKDGDAFFEPPNKKILHFDNVSETDPATFIAYYLLGKGEKELIKMLE